MVRYPFFIIVDDAGFESALPDGQDPVGMEVYENIVRLARSYSMRIPLCITARFLDRERLSRWACPLLYADELVAFLKENEPHVEIGYHGLTHEWEDHVGEFYCLDTSSRVPERVQRDHIEESRQIFASCGMPFPELFVPPYHAWEEGVTDRMLAEYGVRYLVGYRKLRFRGRCYRWRGSQHLRFLPRESLGLNGCDTAIAPDARRKIRLYPHRTILEFSKDHVIPQRLPTRFRFRKTLCNTPIHSYMTHIGNFFDECMDFWWRFFEQVERRPDIVFCTSNAHAVICYEHCLGHSGER